MQRSVGFKIKANRTFVMLLFRLWCQLRKMPSFVKDRSESSPDGCIMFGDFYAFATRLAHLCDTGAVVPMNATHALHCDGNSTNYRIGAKRMAYQVFLGGSCNPTTWRSEIAIPTLQSLGITYYNPQVSQWGPELIAQEYEAKQTARVLLFVMDNQTRNTAGIIEAAQLAATRSDSLVLVVYPYRQDQTILGESLSAQEYYDLMNGLLVLEYFAERQRIPIFESVSVALDGTSKMVREAINVQDLKVSTGNEQEQDIDSRTSPRGTNGTNCDSWTNSPSMPETEKRDLYVGVVGKDLYWLESSAAPLVESMGLSVHRPSENEYCARTLPEEMERIRSSRQILLVVPQHSRGIAIMTLASHLIGLRAKLVICLQTMPEGTVISGEQLSEQAIKDYNRGRMYLSDYATREGVPVFQNIADALQRAIQLVQNSS